MSECESGSENKGYEELILGIPCKFAEIAIIPKHIYEFFNEGETARCRGGELVTLELMEEYASHDATNAALSELFGIGIVEYTSIWGKRLDALNSREIEWVKVRMKKI